MHPTPVRTQTAGGFRFHRHLPPVFLVSFLILPKGDVQVCGMKVSEGNTLLLPLKDVPLGLRGGRCHGARRTETMPAARGQRETLHDDCSEAESPGLRKPFQ